MDFNRRFILASRPQGVPTSDIFRRSDAPKPDIGEGEILVRNIYIPVDPGMRPALADKRRDMGEFEPFAIGGTVGYITVGRVEASHDPAYATGDWVTGILLWQDYAVARAENLSKIHIESGPTAALGILGVPGLSAWAGLMHLGTPQAGEVVVVTSAAGTVGLIAGQIARNIGCTVIGVAGGAEKCRRLLEDYGFHHAIDYRASDVGHAIAACQPGGVDILFDNVGNAMIDSILPVMRVGGRIVICGQVADYNNAPETRPGIRNTDRFISHRLTMRGLFVYDHAYCFAEALGQMTEWMSDGRLKLDEHIIDGFDTLPDAFASLFDGERMGRTIVRIRND